MDLDGVVGKENRAPTRSFGAPVASSKSLRFSEELHFYEHAVAVQDYHSSSDDLVADTLLSRPLLRDSSDPFKLLPPRRRRGILKATTHPINVVDCAEVGKQRNAPRRHSLFSINVPLDALEKAMAKQGPTFESDALINAVETLEGSLENEANVSTEPKGENDNCSPRNAIQAQRPLTPPNSSSSPSVNDSRALIGLRDVEAAYSRVCLQLRRAAVHQILPAEILAVLRSVSLVIVKCLTRDLENVLHPQAPALIDSSSSSADPSSSAGPGATPVSASKRKKQGRSEAELRRRKVELDVGQAALKLVGIIAQNGTLREAFPPRMVLAFIQTAIRIPSLPTLRSTGDREILAFASWLMGTQTLPADQLGDAVPQMASSLSLILSHPAKANDKTRRIITETLTAIEHLAANYPHQFLSHPRHYIFQVLRFASSQWAPLRDAAVCALGRIALQAASDISRNRIGEAVFHYYRTPLPTDPANPDARKTHLATLAQWMAGSGERNELPWTLTVASILPVVTVEKFRQLEDGGPRIWMSHMQTLLHHPSSDMRQLARFAWNHLAYSWIMHTESYIQSKPDKVWAMSAKPFELLTQILSHDNSETAAAKMLIRSRTLVALIYAFSGFLSEQQSLPTLHTHLTLLFTRLVQNHISALMLNASNDEAREIGWRTLAAICGARDPQGKAYDPVRLLCRPLLAGAALRHSGNLGAVVEQLIAEAIQPDEIAAWSPIWLLENATDMLKLLATALRSAMLLKDASGSSALPVRSIQPLIYLLTTRTKSALERLWRAFLFGLATATRQDLDKFLPVMISVKGEIQAMLAMLRPLPFSGQLSAMAAEVFSELPLSDSAIVAPTKAVDLANLIKGDFTLPEKAYGLARVQLWLSLVPTWNVTVKAANNVPQAVVSEAQLKGLVNFVIAPFEFCGDLPECLGPMLEAASLLSSYAPAAAELLSLAVDAKAPALEGSKLARVTVALLKNRGDSPIVADILQHAVSLYPTAANDDESTLTEIVDGISALLRQQDTVTADSVISHVIIEALSAPHKLALDARHALYEVLTAHILQTVDLSHARVSSFEELLMSVFVSGSVDESITRPALAFKAFWTSWVERGANVADLRSDVLRSIVQGVDASGASQISTLSTIDSQQTIGSESTSQADQSASSDKSMAYDADVSRAEGPTPTLALPELLSSRPVDKRTDGDTMSNNAEPEFVPDSVEREKRRKRPSDKVDSSDDEPTEEEMAQSQAKRARRMSRSPAFAVVIASPQHSSTASPAPSTEPNLRRSLSAPSSGGASPASVDSKADVETFLLKMRNIWEERANNEIRERLDGMDEEVIFGLLTTT